MNELYITIEEMRELSQYSNNVQLRKMQEQMYNDAKIGEYSSSFIRSEEESITPEMLNLFIAKGFNVEELNEEEIIISW